MMKRAISVGFSALLMLSALVVLNIVPVMNVSATNDPFDMGGGIWITPPGLDWTVELGSKATYGPVDNCDTIIVNGNLIVKQGYSLTLTSVNLQMNGPSDGAFTITVESGGTLIIKDGDNNPTTTVDRSVVNSSNPAYRFGFVVEGPNGEIQLTNSELSDCGWEQSSANDWVNSGLWIGTVNVLNAPIISGNEIYDCVIGVTLFQSTSGADISDNDIHDVSFAGIEINQSNNAVVDNNVLTTVGSFTDSYAIHAWTGTNNVISNNEVVDHQYYGMFLMAQSGITVDHNIVRNAPGSGAALILFGLSGDNYATYNDIYDITWSGLFIQGLGLGANMYVNNNTVHDILFTDGTVGIVQQNLDFGHLESFHNTVYNIVETGASSLRDVGITALGGEGHVIAENTVYDVSDMGIWINADNVTIANNEIYGCGDADPSSFFWDSGLYVGNSANARIIGNTIYSNHGPTIGSVQGIQIEYSTNTMIEDTELSDNEINLWGFAANDILMENCTLTNGSWTQGHFDLDTDTDVVLMSPDGTWDNNSALIDLNFDTTSSLTVKWWLDVQVTRNSVGENGVDVTVTSTGTGGPDPSSGQPFVTQNEGGQNGWVKWIPVTEYTETTDGATQSQNFFTPHWVNATATDSIGLRIPTVWKDKSIEVPLNEIPEVISLQAEGGATSVFRVTDIKIQANAQDGEDPESALTPEIEYRVSDTSPWEDTNFTGSASYVGGQWEIVFNSPADSPLGFYDFRVRVKDTYPSYSDWWVEDDMLEVKNNPPTVVSTSPEAPSVLRGDIIWVIAVGNDVEDAQNALDCEIQYKAPGGSWSGPDTTISDVVYGASGWTADFKPRTSPTKDPKGDYDFRFQFQDTDGGWSGWQENNAWIEVLNNPPEADDIQAGETFVYRNEQGDFTNYVWLFANVTELEDPENSLTVFFEYLEPGVPGWQSGFIDHTFTLSYDSSAGLWKVQFIPEFDAKLGSYNFRVGFTDDDGDSDTVSGSGLLQVMNNAPEAIDITPSDNNIRAGVADLLHIQVNADDTEDAESLLTIGDIEWQYNGPNKGDRPGTWSGTWFGDVGYDATGGGHVWVEFEPPSSATPGWYGFRVKVMDQDDDMSDPWLILYDAVEVKSPKPDIEYVTPEVDEVYRENQMTIRMKGDDAVDDPDQLVPHLEFKKKGTSIWTEISGSTSYNSGGGYWEVYWTPGKTLDTGQYEFQGRFENTENAFSDYMAGSPDVNVKNNVPTAENIGIVDLATSVDREDTITLYANGDDEETPENQLTAYFEYSAPGDTWDNAYFSGKTYDDGEKRWEIDFKPDGNADLGDYSFQVYFKDGDNTNSDPVVMSDTITVNNVKPIVEDLTVPNSALRGESITITANGADDDGTEGELAATFEYKSPSGSWTPIPGSANYVGSSFRITWTPGANEDVGQYSIRVQFSDDEEVSDWYEDTTTFTLENNEPEVDIDSPQRDGASVTFSATATDEETSDLTYDWDFGDGDTSTEESPSHEYSKSGTYDVTLTVTDDEGDTATDTVSITIPGGDVAAGGLDFITLLLLIIIIVVVVVLLLVLLMSKRKKKPEDAIPPAAAPMAPEAPPPAAPMAGLVAGPEVAAPAAVPMAAPAAVAVPAAAPAAAAGGQNIKCPKCGNAFTEARTERPITIQCPSCGAKGTLT